MSEASFRQQRIAVAVGEGGRAFCLGRQPPGEAFGARSHPTALLPLVAVTGRSTGSLPRVCSRLGNSTTTTAMSPSSHGRHRRQFYGTTSYGGANNLGVLYKVTPPAKSPCSIPSPVLTENIRPAGNRAQFQILSPGTNKTVGVSDEAAAFLDGFL
jgi:uncharacterized repeat protein (TIGR03803 family)